MWNVRQHVGVTLHILGLGACLVSVMLLGLGAGPARCSLIGVGGVVAVAVGSYLALSRP